MKRQQHSKPVRVICLVLLGVLALPAVLSAGLFWAAYTLMDRILTRFDRQGQGR